jgi:restriction system protein
MTIWLVRCGGDGAYEQNALAENIVGIGWGTLGDLSNLHERDEIRARYIEAVPNESVKQVQTNLAQVYAFRSRIQIGDIVALPLKGEPMVAFGRVVGDYRFVPNAHQYVMHQRNVEWIGSPIPRSSIDQDLLYTLGAFLTVCQVKNNDAENRLNKILGLNLHSNAVTTSKFDEPQSSDVDESIIVDLEEVSADLISKRIAERFFGHQLSELVGAILEAEGLTVLVSTAGPDGGVDVLAGSGPFGFDEPKIAVQVKSGKQVVDAPTIRELQGTMKAFKATQGLVVSWSGYTPPARKEARQDFFGIRLWAADDLVKHFIDSYEKLPEHIRSEVPLKQIHTLILD